MKDEFENWNPRDPILIDAPTGSGKNTFIINELIPKAKKMNKNILILSNRIALSVQQKILIMKSLGSPLIRQLTDEGIIATDTFDNIKILTYHSLSSFLEDANNKEWCKKLLYVIIDEAHFFISDCLFNERCGYILKQIVYHFCSAIRVYLTATSWDVLYPISQIEETQYHEFVKTGVWQPPRMCIRYYFPRDFSNVSLSFIEDINDIPDLIKTDSEGKWLIFIDNREKGKELCKKLPCKCDYLDAQNKNSKVWKQITEQEAFDNQVLVTTSVLDNGVNIKDSKLKNIVVFSDSRTSLIQMLGRKRCAENEKIKLWVCNIPDTTARRHFNSYKELCTLYDKYELAVIHDSQNSLINELWYSDNTIYRKLFYMYQGKLYQNTFARYAIERKFDFYRKLVEDGIPFSNFVQEWLYKPKVIPKKKIDILLDFCETNLGKILFDEDNNTLRQHIVNACREAKYYEPHKNRVDVLKRTSLNNRLVKLAIPYRIEDKSKGWIIVRYEEVENDI